MEARTQKLIDILSQMNSRNEIFDKIDLEFNSIRSTLQKKGFNFHNFADFEMIKEGQVLNNRNDLPDLGYYEELDFIKNGVSKGWATNFRDRFRFEEIQRNMHEVLNKF